MQKGEQSKKANEPPTNAPQQIPVAVTQTILNTGKIQALATVGGPQQSIGIVPSVSGVNLPTVSFTLPRTNSQSSAAQPLQVSGASLSNTQILSPQAVNTILQQQLSGVVGLTTVTAQGLQQVLQAPGTPLTLVAASSPEAAAVLEQRRKIQLLRQKQKQTGSTVHHLGPKGLANPSSNANHVSLVAKMNSVQTGLKESTTASSSVSSSHAVTTALPSVKDAKLLASTQNSSTGGESTTTRTAPALGGPSPKKIKLEEKPAPNKEVADLRTSVCSHKQKKMKEIKGRYRDNLTELFYLQGGGNMVEFQNWNKRPSQPLMKFLEGSKLDSDDEDIQERRINDEVKVLTNAGSNIPVATPVAISTTLPPSVSALSQQAMNAATVTTSSLTSTPLTSTTSSSELKQHLTHTDIKINAHSLKTSTISSVPPPSKSIKSTSSSPGRSRQDLTNVYDNVTGSPDVIVERAKQEAQVLQRVNELRKEGMWTAKRLPKVQEPPRQKAHWDYLLEEMTWLAADFIQERKWKKATAKKIARMVSNYFKEQEQKELKAEKEEAVKLKKISSQMAKMVKEFWTNIEKVVQYKQTTRLEEKKKKALDLHLNFIVDQTEKYSSWLTAGLQTDGSKTSSLVSDSEGDLVDAEFQPHGTASDDEETIEKEEKEAGCDEDATKKEIEALQKESEMPLEEILKSLPKEMLDEPSSALSDHELLSEEPVPVKEADTEFTGEGEEDGDIEETIEEQEKEEKKNYTGELDELKAEGEMSVEELMKKYAGAYDSDFEMPDASSDDDGSEDEESSESEKETSDSSEEMDSDVEKDENVNAETAGVDNGVGLEFLVQEEKTTEAAQTKPDEKEIGPGKEFSDIAAAAESLQPKGYTLETTEVITKVPFLLKHTLREYQHVGLDWLATMYEKRLNGILADEMGLGKTIQTIAVLAHLACDKGIWGPHLIVVPTSVMLNWEMELKKWCPAFKILTYYGSIKERKLKRQGWTKTNAFHVCITSYKLVVQDHQAFRRKKWKYFILDEAQNIKNFKSQRWQMLLNFSSQRRLLLTGTPLQNSLMELWSLMHFLMPNVFQSHSEFKEWFSNPLTGMIEGSQEYNESLVRRLHKVLRPFLLRRLKNEVEKQMPQKYEHVVMCRLSKRQRYLYDDFMSQTKTKETLASGHFMSVINILMQLRKVCNHPNLFDPRPVVSPFKMEGIVYRTASLATKALEYDPFKHIDVLSMYRNLADMETDLPAFVAQRVFQLQAPRKLIEEIDSLPEPPPRPIPGQLKNLKSISAAVFQQSNVSSSTTDQVGTLSAASTFKVLSTSTTQSSQSSTVNSIKLLLPTSGSSSAQQSILIPNPSGSGLPLILPLSTPTTNTSGSSSSSTTATIAQAKLISSQLQSGMLQLVQTSSGHQVITAVSSSSASSTSASTTSSSTANVSLLKISSVQNQKPVMKVSPFVVTSTDTSSTSGITTSAGSVSASMISQLSASLANRSISAKPIKKSELFLESLYRKKESRRRHMLSHMARVNQQRCLCTPLVGSDVHQVVDCMTQLDPSNAGKSPSSQATSRRGAGWGGCGYINCLFAQDKSKNHIHPGVFWRETSYLQAAVHSPDDYLLELKEMLNRFVFVNPSVISSSIQMHVSYPNLAGNHKVQWLESQLKPWVSGHSSNLHPIQAKMAVQFPELRLIQYDCGKLQTLDLLLRRLKSGQHRALIFTQMTKMLDVLEAFLNFHGHRYLRLDGTTKVEQRQYLMDRFNADARIFCFILSTRSGGVGVNLTGADTVIFYDSDWNPTMDAQAQDRCHRIGQTRDVHIYRLVSEMTVEENILKKANQKRLLGDLAIEGGNFTTAFFKEQTISDLFAEPSGLQSLVQEKAKIKQEDLKVAKEKVKVVKKEAKESKEEKPAEQEGKREEGKKEAVSLVQFEQALCKAEDEMDAQAAKQLQAEQKAELAEFDESIPWDEREAEMRKEEEEVSRVEMELAMLDKELSPIERYAVSVMEAQMEPETAEELKMAEEDIENSKKDWELARLKALKEEEERKAELEEDEMLYIYSKEESQMFVSDIGGEEMPMWCPPTPPQDDNDIYMDDSLHFLYEPHTMPEQSLPPIYVPKAHKKPKLEAITTRKQKQRKEEQPRVPRSLFDKPKEVVNKQRKEAKIQRLRQNMQQQQTPQTATPKTDPDSNFPEWLVHEEWALLEAVQNIQKLSPDLIIDSPAQTVNWDFVADFVSFVGRIFRAAKSCRGQYDSVVLPREDGRNLMLPMKQKKTPKSIYKTKNSRPLRTEQLYLQDGIKNNAQLYSMRFGSMMDIGAKRPTGMRQTMVNPAAKPTKHATILAESGISYDAPMLPRQLAAKRAERIALEKKKQQAQQAQQTSVTTTDQNIAQRTAAGQAVIAVPAASATIPGQQLSNIVSVTPTTVIAGQVPKMTVGPGLTAVSIARTIGATGNIIVNAPAATLNQGPFAAINKRMSQAAALPSTIAVSGNLTPAMRGQRTTVAGTTAITMQEVATVAGTSTTLTVAAAARPGLQTTVASTGQLTNQKLAAMAASTGTQLVHHRSLTHQQINILRQNPSIVRAHAATGTQQLKAQKLLTPEQIRTQQLKHPQQKVITQQLLVPVRGGQVQSILPGGKQQGLLRTTKMTEEQLQNLRMRTQIQTQTQGKQLQTAQIIQGQVTQVGQSASSSTHTPVALVKSVSAPSATVPVTIPVSAISVGQQRTIVASRTATVSQIQQQQRMQLLQQQKAGTQRKITGLSTTKGQIPLLIPQGAKLNKVLAGSSQFLQQMALQSPGALQQIMTHSSQPTIITQVSQPITQMVAKVALTSGSQTLTPGTPITVTHQASSGSGTQATQFLQVTPAPSSTTASQSQTTVTVPASLVATATALRGISTSNLTSTAQISLVSTSSTAQAGSASASAQTQKRPVVTSLVGLKTADKGVARSAPAPAAIATVVTQSQTSPQTPTSYTMRTRTTKQ